MRVIAAADARPRRDHRPEPGGGAAALADGRSSRDRGTPVQYELAALSADHHAVIAELRRRTRDVVRGVVDQGLATGEFVVDDADLATLALLSLGIDVARWYRPGRWTPEEIGRSYAGLALRMVCPDPDSQI